MENNKLIKAESGLIKQVGTAISITNKLLSKPNEPLLIPYRKKNRWGFCLKDKRIIIDCIYEDVFPFAEGKALVKRNGKWGIINQKGEIITDIIYESISEFTEDMAKAYIYTSSPDRDRKFGFIDSHGKVVVPFIYDDARSFSEGLAMVEKDQKIGFINSEGNLIIDFIYDRVMMVGREDIGFYKQHFFHKTTYIFNDGLCKVSKSPLAFGFINKEGKTVIPFNKYELVFPFSEGLAAVAKYEQVVENTESLLRWGFIDKAGNEVIECAYQYVSSFFEELAVVQLNNYCGFINSKGEQVIPCIYVKAMPFSEGIAAVMVKIDGDKSNRVSYKWGYIDKHGNTLIPLIYDGRYTYEDREPYVTPCKEGLISIEKDGKYGHIDRTGCSIIEFKYKWTSPFANGLSLIRLDGDDLKEDRAYINKQGVEFYEE